MREYQFIRERQPGVELYSFIVPAEELIGLARVERFNETREGVQRALNYDHVLKLKRFMQKPNSTIAEPIIGNMEGGWEVHDKRGVISANDDSYLSVDDGQQRVAALHLLTREERARWQFKVTATLNMPHSERVSRFLQQTLRLRIDNNLILQMQDRIGAFPDAISSRAYAVAKHLATEESSPLHGLLRLEEKYPVYEPSEEDSKLLEPLEAPAKVIRQNTLGVINVNDIFRTLRKVVSSSHSLILHHDPDAQYQVICRLLSAAQEIWPTAWADPKHYFLRRSAGIKALLELLVVGQHFGICLTTQNKTSRKEVSITSRSLKSEQIVEVLSGAKHYDWSYQRFRAPNLKFPSPTEIAQQIDSLIFQKFMPKKRTVEQVAG